MNIKINEVDLNLRIISKKHKDSAGIYIIINKINLKFYIGSSIELYKRIQHHKNSLMRGDHNNKYLQNAFNKYGKNNFSFYLIEEIPKNNNNFENNLRLKEEEWIIKLNACEYGYNLTTNPIRPLLGRKLSEETKNKLRIQKLGKNNPMYGKIVSLKQVEQMRLLGKSLSKKVFQLDINNQIIKIWDSMADIKNHIGFDPSGISQCCNRILKTYKGYVWRFVDEYDENEIFDFNKENIKYNNIFQYDFNNILVKIWGNVLEIKKELGYKPSSIYRCLRGERKKYKGFIWCCD